jgi:hypothetical protein
MPRLFHRRQIWLPTLWGALLLGGVAAAIVVFGTRAVGGYLSASEPASGGDGRGAHTLVVEGWLDESELNEAIATFRRGHYERVVTAGGPIDSWQDGVAWPTFAERAASYLKRHGLRDVPVEAAPAPASAQDRTFLSAVMVRDWARRERVKLDAIDLFSVGVHARRSRLVFRMALGPGVEVGVLAAVPHRYDVGRWWKTSEGVKAVVGEVLSLAWTKCCFWPAAPGSHEELWAVPKTPA